MYKVKCCKIQTNSLTARVEIVARSMDSMFLKLMGAAYEESLYVQFPSYANLHEQCTAIMIIVS